MDRNEVIKDLKTLTVNGKPRLDVDEICWILERHSVRNYILQSMSAEKRFADILPTSVIREIKSDWIVTEGAYIGFHHALVSFSEISDAMTDCYALKLRGCYLIIRDDGICTPRFYCVSA